MGALLGGIGFVIFLIYGVIQIYAGYLGIEYHLSAGWAIAALACAFLLRFTIPITIGSFFCALDIWHWHWAGAAIFAAPGLLLIIPGVLAALIDTTRR